MRGVQLATRPKTSWASVIRIVDFRHIPRMVTKKRKPRHLAVFKKETQANAVLAVKFGNLRTRRSAPEDRYSRDNEYNSGPRSFVPNHA
jgi:hypothetical protein